MLIPLVYPLIGILLVYFGTILPELSLDSFVDRFLEARLSSHLRLIDYQLRERLDQAIVEALGSLGSSFETRPNVLGTSLGDLALIPSVPQDLTRLRSPPVGLDGPPLYHTSENCSQTHAFSAYQKLQHWLDSRLLWGMRGLLELVLVTCLCVVLVYSFPHLQSVFCAIFVPKYPGGPYGVPPFVYNDKESTPPTPPDSSVAVVEAQVSLPFSTNYPIIVFPNIPSAFTHRSVAQYSPSVDPALVFNIHEENPLAKARRVTFEESQTERTTSRCNTATRRSASLPLVQLSFSHPQAYEDTSPAARTGTRALTGTSQSEQSSPPSVRMSSSTRQDSLYQTMRLICQVSSLELLGSRRVDNDNSSVIITTSTADDKVAVPHWDSRFYLEQQAVFPDTNTGLATVSYHSSTTTEGGEAFPASPRLKSPLLDKCPEMAQQGPDLPQPAEVSNMDNGYLISLDANRPSPAVAQDHESSWMGTIPSCTSDVSDILDDIPSDSTSPRSPPSSDLRNSVWEDTSLGGNCPCGSPTTVQILDNDAPNTDDLSIVPLESEAQNVPQALLSKGFRSKDVNKGRRPYQPYLDRRGRANVEVPWHTSKVMSSRC